MVEKLLGHSWNFLPFCSIIEENESKKSKIAGCLDCATTKEASFLKMPRRITQIKNGCIAKWDNLRSSLLLKRSNMNNEKVNKGRYRLALKAKKRDMSVPIFGLEKIPAEPLLKLALEEIGEQESYIEELEDKVKQLEKERLESWKENKKTLVQGVKSEALIQAKRNQYYSKLESKLIKASEHIRRLSDARDELLKEVLTLKEQIQRLSE